jgi:DNA-binding SARP family transcriptional activator
LFLAAWPDIAEDAARANLRSALTELRQGLGIASRLLAPRLASGSRA